MLDISKSLQRLPLLVPALAWLLGLAAARMDGISWQLDLWLLLILCVFWALRWQRLFCLWGILGLFWGGLCLLNDARQVQYDSSWVGHEIVVQADIESLRIGQSSTRLRLKNIQRDDGATLAGKVDVYVWRNKQRLQSGQRVQLKTKLHAPENRHNPGGFDYEAYCFDRHIALMGGVRGAIQVVDAKVGLLNDLRAKVRASLPHAIGYDKLQIQGQRGVLQALLLAERNDIPVHIQEAFAATGAAHLLAISGLHIGMVAAWGAMLCWWLLTRREAWIVRFSVRHCSLAFGVLCAVAYATIAGWPLPTQRAALMLAAAALAWYLRSRYQPVNTLFAALILILLWDASAVLSISLWLSFVATLALILFASHHGEARGSFWLNYLKGLMVVSVVAALATLPLITGVFGRLPVWSLPANLLLVPLYGGWILPWALLGEIFAVFNCQSLAEVFMTWAGLGIDVSNAMLLQMHAWPGGNLWLPNIALYWGLFYLFGFLMAALLWLRMRKKFALLMISGVLFIYTFGVVPEEPQTASKFVVWDVGQGAAASLIQPMANQTSHVMVVDVPGRKGSRFNGGTTVASGLRALGLAHVDVLILSHAQADHAGGAQRLLDSVRDVSELWLADVPANHGYTVMQHVVQRVISSGGMVRWLKQGDVLRMGGATVTILWPPKAYAPGNDNNTSLVLSVALNDGIKLFLAGDMEKPVERALLKNTQLQSHTLMLMPHHGSRTSSTPLLVKRLQAEIVVAQTGRHNHFGFPKEDVLQRYRDVGSDIWNTADGAIVWHIKDRKVQQFHMQKGAKRDAALQWVDLLL
ncbi:MAG: DNA internalization-related competence protein ComEC/Rec2 [Mariprofundaceae bacterium]|nr:DNA internalization-related competence protein ComEC/Rec2 [Mariprofundaceae bacterium]